MSLQQPSYKPLSPIDIAIARDIYDKLNEDVAKFAEIIRLNAEKKIDSATYGGAFLEFVAAIIRTLNDLKQFFGIHKQGFDILKNAKLYKIPNFTFDHLWAILTALPNDLCLAVALDENDNFVPRTVEDIKQDIIDACQNHVGIVNSVIADGKIKAGDLEKWLSGPPHTIPSALGIRRMVTAHLINLRFPEL